MNEDQQNFDLLSEVVDQGTLYFMFNMMKDRHGWDRERFSFELRILSESGRAGFSIYDAASGKFNDVGFDQVDFMNDEHMKKIDVFPTEKTIDEYNRTWPLFSSE